MSYEINGFTVELGKAYRFAYPIEFTSLPEYSAHRGATVMVVRQCAPSEADELWDDLQDGEGDRLVDVMFKVRAEDGWEGDAWHSELHPL